MENGTDIELLNYLGGIFASTESKKETRDWADNLEETKQRLLRYKLT